MGVTEHSIGTNSLYGNSPSFYTFQINFPVCSEDRGFTVIYTIAYNTGTNIEYFCFTLQVAPSVEFMYHRDLHISCSKCSVHLLQF